MCWWGLLPSALRESVSGRRGAERPERSEDGTPAARDPSEARGTPSGDSTCKLSFVVPISSWLQEVCTGQRIPKNDWRNFIEMSSRTMIRIGRRMCGKASSSDRHQRLPRFRPCPPKVAFFARGMLSLTGRFMRLCPTSRRQGDRARRVRAFHPDTAHPFMPVSRKICFRN
jgi:hypothetical protein